MIKMVALRPHLYAGRRLQVGDEFEARGRGDASLLAAVGFAAVAVDSAPKPLPALPEVVELHAEPVYSAPMPVAEPVAEEVVEAAPEPEAISQPEPELSPYTSRRAARKQTYRRRDLNAE